jgi:EAL domain-containing protein (putative c-di-GMP-specific phosphodiesterase class I)
MSRLMKLALDPMQLQLNYQPIVDCQELLTPIDWLECLVRGAARYQSLQPTSTVRICAEKAL